MKTSKFLFLITCISCSLLSCEEEEKNPTLNDFCRIKPTGWDCEIIQNDFNKNDIPQNAKEPVAVLKYKNTSREFTHLSGERLNPSLILDLYPIAQKKELINFIKSQQLYSWCIPIYYGETKDYFILTSPCFINAGTFSEQADSSIGDLREAIDKVITKSNYGLIQN
ncbi:MAG TPA: hypothetical protein PK325_06795 [Cyclobacteriaceae bacterium]|nr:hypothetical protein [Cyclobacteriaceae bacterium]HMV09012.1 hypothetical protein [Cyclobacteriaceae bacterium]HMV88672.1 hypothetical protein [Cyclobacteriaceae bacterium]HMW99583.1 hypothetical protein [Cyclobacteriaceae bacterium]HMX51634.1 hypothetical protein [Cyclobacteriaceae bacterium]